VTTSLRVAVRREGAGDVEVSLDVPSDLGFVGPAVELVLGACPSPLSPRRLRFNLRTALAEALCNAIAYGNRCDPTKLVHVRMVVASDAVQVHVTDHGEGFDPARIPDPTLSENRERDAGRGLFVLRHLVDHVSFNDKGNVICLTLWAG
jgi:serine/threonine-protein kinase RsbW